MSLINLDDSIKFILRIIHNIDPYSSCHQDNLGFFICNWLPWQQQLTVGFKNVILSCVIASSIEDINII